MLLFDLTSQTWSKWLAMPEGVISFPAWSRDSKYMYFDDLSQYQRIAVGQHRPEFVASTAGLRELNGRWGTWSSISPDGAPMFVRDISTHEIYALDVQLP